MRLRNQHPMLQEYSKQAIFEIILIREELLADIPSTAQTMIQRKHDWLVADQHLSYQGDEAWCLRSHHS